MYPLGNGDASLDQLSLFLGVADAKKMNPGWSKRVRFRLQVVNQLNAAKTISKGETTCCVPQYVRALIHRATNRGDT